MDAQAVAAWLRETRERQIDPQTGGSWTQDHFLDLLKAETGWALHRPSYSAYENGRSTPRPATLAKFVRFWAGHDEPGPDLSVKVPIEVVDPVAAAIDRQTDAIAANTEMLAAVLSALTGPHLTPEGQRWMLERQQAAIRRTDPTPVPDGTAER